MQPSALARSRPRSHLAPFAAALLAVAITGVPSAVTATTPVNPQPAPVFDSARVHDIAVTFDAAAYDALIEAYRDTGEKEWIEATVTIDGATFDRVGLRLKGNSSLMGLRGDGDAPGRGTDGGTDGQAGPDGPGASVSADRPEGLPWLIRLDRNIDGQSLDGVTDLVVRSNRSQTSLNEAVALELLAAAGLASQAAAPASFSVNGSDPVLRLIIENPDDIWQSVRFPDAGALYKAESEGDWSYRGEDPDAYTDVFDQEAGKDVTDLTPLIGFLRWLDESDDAAFAIELPGRLDVDAFAAYLAMMDLVGNFDDIDGPGNNAYLHWDAASGTFTIVPWDMNLAFGAMGGGRFRMSRGDEWTRPPTGRDPAGSPRPEQQARPGGGFARDRSNPLVERFHAVPGFEARYQQALTDLRAELFSNGIAQAILDRWTKVLTDQATSLVAADAVAQEAAAISRALQAP